MLTNEKRLLWIKNLCATAFLYQLWWSAPTWAGERFMAHTPVSNLLPQITSPIDYTIFGLIALLSIASLVYKRPRLLILTNIFLVFGYSLFDQSRWVPFSLHQLALYAAIAFSYTSKEHEGAALRACSLVFIGTYFWSGIQKFNAVFIVEFFPWLIKPFFGEVDHSGILILGLGIPFIELALGILLLIPSLRSLGVAVGIAMHLLILTSIGPIGHNYNHHVWAWNIVSMILLILIFSDKSISYRALIFPKLFFNKVFLVLFCLMPLFNLFGKWDDYLSMSLYSGNTLSARWRLTEEDRQSLPIKLQAIVERDKEDPDKPYLLSYTNWSIAELGNAGYPCKRVFKKVGKKLCQDLSDGIILRIYERPNRLNGKHESTDFSCTSLSP